MPYIPINSGTGPNIAVDSAGGVNYQLIKIVQANAGDTASPSNVLTMTGTLSIANNITVTGTSNVAITNTVNSVRVAPTTRLQGFTIETNSSSAIVITSGAHTIYVTDLLISVDIPMNVSIRSATTQVANVYLATKGGFVFPTNTPMVLNSAQSLTVLPSVSGSCSAYAAGYSVT